MFKKYKKIHFVGIGGIGISALAKWAILDGIEISGSDAHRSSITDELAKMGAKIFIGHKADNVPKDVDLIIYSFAVPKINPERQNEIEQLSYFEALGEFTNGKNLIAVSGTNGKSTTTAMLGKILLDAGTDPTIIVGSKIKDFKYGNFHLGKSDLVVVEACEHNAHMLELSPKMIVLTNIEKDHLDFYKNLKNILSAFKKYIGKLPKSGKLIYNNNDPNTLKTIGEPTSNSKSYGLEGADYSFRERHIKNGKQFFTICDPTSNSEENIELQIPGLYNVYNAMAAIAAAKELGVSIESAKKSLVEFNGLWRRFEVLGEYSRATVISDYGHHPHAIEGTLLATREFYPGCRIILAFEPHQHHRTKALFADFVRSFDNADILILSEIYNVEGRIEAKDRDISSKKLAQAVHDYWQSGEDKLKDRQIYYGKDLAKTEKIIQTIIKKNDILIIMGAGDIYKIAERFCRIKN